MSTRRLAAMVLLAVSCSPALADDYLGQLSANPYDPSSTSNPFGAGSPFKSESVNNPFGRYGSPYSNQSATNPYATDAPKLYDSDGQYRGKLSSNPYDPESVSNPFGRYGSPYSSESINNPFGAGSPFASDSPTNPYGRGLSVFGERREDPFATPRAPTRSYDFSTPSVPTMPSYERPTNGYRSTFEPSAAPRVSPYQYQAPTNPFASPRPSQTSGTTEPWKSPFDK